MCVYSSIYSITYNDIYYKEISHMIMEADCGIFPNLSL